MSVSTLCVTLVLLASTTAAVVDVRERRIPNWLTLTLFVIGICLHGALQGWGFAMSSFLIGTTVLVAGSFVYRLGWLAGGDIKLLAAGAATLGLPDGISFILYSGIAGGALAVFMLVRQKRFASTMIHVTRGLVLTPGHIDVDRSRQTLPYALAIAFGAAGVAVAHTYTMAVTR